MASSSEDTVDLPVPWRDAAVTVVLPTYNEAGNLPVLVSALLALPLPNLRVLVVDDDSPDGTGKVADELAASSDGRVIVVHRTVKEGLGRAYVDGMSRALDDGAEYVVQMDSDLSHPPEYIPQMLGTLLATRAGVVIGSRYVAGGSLAKEWGFNRRLLSGWANFYVEALLRMRVRDVTAGYKIWARQTLLDIGLDRIHSNGYSFQVEIHYLAARSGHKIVEIPIHFEERAGGISKMTLAVKLESAKVPFQLRWRYRR
jgi:dolichol-phosphate mannosyltransferase